MENRTEVYEELIHRKVWIPCIRGEKNSVRLALLINDKKDQYIPAFYGQESRLGNFEKEKLVQMDFLLLRHTLIDLPEQVCGIVIEPFEQNILLDRKTLADLDSQTKGMTCVRQEHRGRIALAIPKKLPDGLEKAVRRFLSKKEGVRAAWIVLAKREGEKGFHLLVSVDSDINRIQLFPELAEVIRPFMKAGEQFELTGKGPMMDEAKFAKAKVYSRA